MKACTIAFLQFVVHHLLTNPFAMFEEEFKPGPLARFDRSAPSPEEDDRYRLEDLAT
jgi:hypothetical protein